jgi:hypothetical protein
VDIVNGGETELLPDTVAAAGTIATLGLELVRVTTVPLVGAAPARYTTLPVVDSPAVTLGIDNTMPPGARASSSSDALAIKPVTPFWLA